MYGGNVVSDLGVLWDRDAGRAVGFTVSVGGHSSSISRQSMRTATTRPVVLAMMRVSGEAGGAGLSKGGATEVGRAFVKRKQCQFTDGK